MAFRKIDEAKKKIQAELAQKYPMQNPRTNVVAVVTKRDVPQRSAKSNGQTYAPAINRDVNAHTKVEEFPLHVNKPTKVNTILQRKDDGFYVKQAADGWKRYQTDESNRLVLERDKSYRKWRSQGGSVETLDKRYKPTAAWSVSENNTFGYLYGQDKQKAYDYAKNLNDLLSKRFDSIEESLEEGARKQGEKLKDFGERVWNNHTAAQQANSTAHKVQAEQVERIGKTALKANASALNAQAEQNRQGTNAGVKVTEKIIRGLAESGGNLLRAQSAVNDAANERRNREIEFAKQSHREFKSNPKKGSIQAHAVGILGSDQTGASIYGYREDTSYKEPNDTWSSGERQLHEFYSITNPKKAEAYAIRVNDRYNQRKKDEKTQAVRDWTSRSAAHGAAAWTGARGLNLGAGIDGMNQQLELAARGVVTVNPDLSASDIVETVDDTNASNLSEKHGVGAGIAYRVGTDVADAMISRGVNYMPVAKVSKDNIVRVHDVNEAIKAFNEGYLGVRNNDKGAHEGVLAGVANAGVGYGAGVVMEKPLKKLFGSNEIAKGIVEESAVSVVDNTVVAGSKKWFEQNQTEIERRKKNYMQEKGITGRKAWWMATKELIEQSLK